MVDQGSYTYQTAGYCQCACATINKPVMATYKGSDCYCGDLLPPTGSAASNSSCNTPCQGYDITMCGGDGFWSVALTGIDASVGNSPAGSGSSSASSSQIPTVTQTAAPSVITKAGQTVVVTASSSSAHNSQGNGGSSKVGIATGVVVGTIAISAIVGGVYFFLRQRKRKAVEEEFRRSAAANSFVGGKSKSEVSSTNDQRLDPSVMFARRQSIGSIADERDFSRRILQVGHFAPWAVEMLVRPHCPNTVHAD
jgi:cell wall integrity and stress response component